MFSPSELERHCAASRFATTNDRTTLVRARHLAELPQRSLTERLFGRERRIVHETASAVMPIVLRPARDDDADAIERLAELDGCILPSGARVIAESGGRLLAAADIASGASVADPFTPTAAAVALVRMRAAQLRA